MQATEAQIQRLSRLCRQRLGRRKLTAPPTYPDSLALCLIDTVQSSAAQSSAGGAGSVAKVIARYRAHRAAQGGDAETDGAVGLLGTFHDLGSAAMWARVIGTSEELAGDPAGRTKAEVIETVANALSDIELYSAADLRDVMAYPDLVATVRKAWESAIGPRADSMWRRLLAVAGVPGVWPDRYAVRFVAGGLGEPPASVSPEFAAETVERVAAALAVPAYALEQAMSRWERGR